MVNKKEIISKIGSILTDIGEQYNYLAKDLAHINELEMELFMANAIFLTDHIAILQRLATDIENAETSQSVKRFSDAANKQEVVRTVSSTLIQSKFKKDKKNKEEEEGVFTKNQQPTVAEKMLNTPVLDTNISEIKHHETESLLPNSRVEAIHSKNTAEQVNATDLPKSVPSWQTGINSEDDTTFDFEKKGLDELYDRPLTPAEKEFIDYKVNLAEDTVKEVSDIESDKLTYPDFKPVDQFSINTEPFTSVLDTLTPVYPYADSIKIPEAIKYSEQDSLLNKPSINDMHQKNTFSRNIDSLSSIKDLKNMITMNDKLVYIKELFSGYSLAYSEAIQLLNQFSHFDDATQFLQSNYAKSNNWADKKMIVDKFYDVLKKRY